MTFNIIKIRRNPGIFDPSLVVVGSKETPLKKNKNITKLNSNIIITRIEITVSDLWSH